MAAVLVKVNVSLSGAGCGVYRGYSKLRNASSIFRGGKRCWAENKLRSVVRTAKHRCVRSLNPRPAKKAICVRFLIY